MGAQIVDGINGLRPSARAVGEGKGWMERH